MKKIIVSVPIRIKYIFICFFVFVFFSIFLFLPKTALTSSSPKINYKILLDAGHGGIDVGAVGVSGAKESDINLAFTLALGKLLKKYGFEVALTRSDFGGLYSEYKNGFKMEDMNIRKEMIENGKQDLFISIHQNKFSSSASFGPQIFYKPDDDNSQALATCIQKSLIKNLGTKSRAIKEGDFYLLNCSPCPSVLIECGFLSNPEEEKLLQSKDYQQKFCNYVMQGIFTFFA